MSYNYYNVMYNDIDENVRWCHQEDGKFPWEDSEEAYNELCDELWADDGITGNASGSYFCNSAKAMEAVSDNHDLLRHAAEDFGYSAEHIGNLFMEEKYEEMDVMIRCYLLGQVLQDWVNEIPEEEFTSPYEDDDDDEE